MSQQILLGGDGVTGELGSTHNSKANSNFTELYAATAAAQADADAAQTSISDHISDSSSAHAGSSISFTPAGGLSSTDVQAAIVELAGAGGVGSASTTAEGIIELLTQGEMNNGTDALRAATAETVKNRDGAVTALTPGSSVAISSDKCTLATSAATVTFSITHTGDDMQVNVTLSATSATYTFPSGSLCVVNGIASGDNTAGITGVSGDLHVICIRKMGSTYQVVIKNFGQ